MPDLRERLQNGLADRYRLERELGRGGMATVFLAVDLRHERPVALKVLAPELASSLGPERFLREIKLAARLQHPHILSVHDSGEADGLLWFTMPYVEGESLADRLRRDKQLPVDEAIRIIHQGLDGGPALTLTDSANSTGGDWGPDGYVYFEVDSGIARIRSSGGPIEPIYNLSKQRSEVGAEWPVVLPQAKGLLFRVRRVAQATGDYEESPASQPQGNVSAFAISPDGKSVAVSLEQSGKQAIWVKQLPGGPASRLTFGDSTNMRPTWTGDGRSLVYLGDMTAPGGTPNDEASGRHRGHSAPAPLPLQVRSGVRDPRRQMAGGAPLHRAEIRFPSPALP